jgi:hypothetical protein
MKAVFAVLLFVGASLAIECPEGICDTVRCESVENCVGRVDPTAGFCGCCPACLKQLGEYITV